ncbi:MAG: helix-turn-helix domain-containing protein [Acidobacteriota bacterium]
MDPISLNGRLRSLVDELVEKGLTLEQARAEFERQYVVCSLQHHGGSIGRSASALGIHRNTLRNKITKLKIEPTEY